MKIFISGSISIKKLSKNAIECLEQVIKENRTVLIGDANWVDKAVQQYLFEQKYQNVIVYFSGEKIRNNIGSWQTKQIPNPENLTGRDRYQLKDKAMAEDCNDGMMVWDGKSKGTKDNVDYMEKLGKKYSIVVSGSVAKIEDFAFSGCTGLISITFPDTIVEIGYKAFSNCTGLTSVTIPASVVKIDTIDILFDFWAFEGCNNLTSIEVNPDNTLFASEEGVLFNKEKTELIKCPNGRRGEYVIPEGVVNLGRRPFSYCKKLTSISILHDNPCFSSKEGVLFSKEGTELIRCPEGRQGNYIIPDTVVNILLGAFDDCIALTSIFLPASVVEMGRLNEITEYLEPFLLIIKEEETFCNCTGLTSIIVDPDNPLYASEDGIMFNKDKTELLVCPKGRQGNYVIPDSVVKIRENAFKDCVGLTSVTIPTSVGRISNYTFEGCTALKTVTIPNSITEIGHCAFKSCIGLTSITIPDSVAKIGNHAFWRCDSLNSIFM
jgi:hypothetical protein